MLDELGYTVYREPFDRFGLVRSKHDPSQPFEFLEQDHYEMIGDLIVKHVQELMIKDYGLVPAKVPIDSDIKGKKEVIIPRIEIIMTPGFLGKKPQNEKALILVQGKGQGIGPGIWSRSVCINENF